MKIILFWIFFLWLPLSPLYSQPWLEHGKILVSAQNPHYLAFEDGTPFFWLGDTACDLFHRLNREEAVFYLQNRAEKKFTVIQVVVLSEFDGPFVPNAYGDLPLIETDPLKPDVTPGNNFADEKAFDYFDHVEYIIGQAEKLGLYIALLPCWGEYVVPREGRGIFNTTEQTYRYGHFMAERFGNFPNIIWILGGDRQPDERKEAVDLWRAMAEGIADGVNGENRHDGQANYQTTLMTHHSYNSSSRWFHHDPWIDFHGWGSYHADFYLSRAFTEVEVDRALKNPKPTLNMEPAYEEHPLNYMANNGYFTAFDVRQIAYWSVFAGACGHTYGAHPVWQFYRATGENSGLVRTDWKKALDFAGAEEMHYLKQLILSRPMKELLPDQSLVVDGQVDGAGHIQAIRGKSYAFIYIPTGAVTTVQMEKISGEKVVAWWYNPRTGEAAKIGEFANKGTQSFDPPGLSKELAWLQTGRGCDWVLVLDDAAALIPPPGQAR